MLIYNRKQTIDKVSSFKKTIIFLTVILHLFFFFFFIPSSQVYSAGILILIPVFLSGWFYGKYIGMIAGFVGVIKTYLLAFLFASMSLNNSNILMVFVNIVFISFSGLIAGIISDTRKELQNEVFLRKKSENLLIEQKKELSDFNHVMSHDLRNVLSVIANYSDILKEDYNEKYVDKIKEKVVFINELLTKSLALADSGLIVDAKENVNLSQLLDETMESLNINGTQIDIGEMPIVKGDSKKLYQVFKNILENAKEHGKPSEIHISSKDLEKKYEILLSNDGNPIDSSIINSFNRKTNYQKTKGRLGLYIIKKLINAHGWSIHVETNPHTSFIIEIPK